jgi:putative transposase
MSNQLSINGIRKSVIELDDGERLLVHREFAEGLLEIDSLRTGASFKVEDPLDGTLKFPDTVWLEDMLRQGRIRIVSNENGPIVTKRPLAELDHEDILKKDPYAAVKRTLVRRLAQEAIDGADPNLSAEATRIWTDEIIPMIEAIRADRPDLAPMKRPATSTIRTWLAKRDPLEATLADMMSKSGRVRRVSSLDASIVEILINGTSWFYASRGRRQIDVRGKVRRDVDELNEKRTASGLEKLPYPGKETIRRYINDALCRDTFAEKYGEAAAKARWDGAGKGLKAVKILALAIIDDTVLDAVSVFDADRNVPIGRPWLCIIMDVHSRCILGWVLSFVPPSVETAAECLRRANRPKTIRPDLAARYPVLAKINGRMDRLLADNGSNYVSPQFQEILVDLGIALQLTAVRSPTQKAMIERLFFTLNTWLLQKLPGHTLDPKLLREFNIDPEKEAVLTLGELELLISEFVNAYHLTIHSGIDAQPARKWEVSMRAHGRDVIADERMLSILTGVVRRDRRLYRGSIRMLGLTYRDDVRSRELNDDLVGAEPHRNRVSSGAAVATVKYKFNPGDLRQVYVWNYVRLEWVTLPCTDLEYASGLSLWQHQQVRAWAKTRNLEFNSEAERLEVRAQLNDLILELAPDLAARERRAVARMMGTPAPVDTGVEFAEAEPRHDGLAPTILHDTADDRTDGDTAPLRAAKTGTGEGRPGEGANLLSDAEEAEGQELPTEAGEAPVGGSTNDDERFEEYR